MTYTTTVLEAPSGSELQFAFAQIKGDICLVQLSAACSALMAADVKVFRHEFISIFRYSHDTAVHPSDLHILDRIADQSMLYEEDKGTVFLARDVMDRLQKLTAGSRLGFRPLQSAPKRVVRPSRITRIH